MNPLMKASVLVAASALLLGCDEKSGNSAKQPAPTPETPQTVLGKSAKMGRDLGNAIEQNQQQALQAANVVTGEGDFLAVGALQVPVPAGWERMTLPPGGMRAGELKIAGEDGPGSVVFFANIGGDVEANLNRWAGQMKNAEGQPAKAEKKVKTVGSLKIHTIALEGTYSGMSAMGASAPPQAGTRFLGAVIEGASSPVQIRFTGPINTVLAAERAWDDMLAGIQAK